MRDTKALCEHADDLIAYLYRELSDKDARNFERHLHECARCESEMTSFGEIRESIISWRDASLGTAWSPHAATATSLAPVRSSAWAALREFLNLSPLWMKGAAAFASVLFCVCAVLAIAYLKGERPMTVQLHKDKIYSQQEMDQQVAQAVMKAEESRKQQETSTKEAGPNDTASRKSTIGAARTGTAYAVNTQSMRKPLTRQERRELAADLGLLAGHDEDDLDLVTDKITQTP